MSQYLFHVLYSFEIVYHILQNTKKQIKAVEFNACAFKEKPNWFL